MFARCRLKFALLFRMGSFTSSPALVAVDNQDDAISFQPGAHEALLERCRTELKNLPSPLVRRFRNYSLQSTQLPKGIVNTHSVLCKPNPPPPPPIYPHRLKTLVFSFRIAELNKSLAIETLYTCSVIIFI